MESSLGIISAPNLTQSLRSDDTSASTPGDFAFVPTSFPKSLA